MTILLIVILSEKERKDHKEFNPQKKNLFVIKRKINIFDSLNDKQVLFLWEKYLDFCPM